MTSANDRQIGGNHYLGEYQHWDWVADIKLPYHPATASKYVDRFKFKGVPEQDLEKAAHYLEKTIELGIVYTPRESYWDFFWNLIATRKHPMDVAAVLFYIQLGKWPQALEGIRMLLIKTRSEAP